MSQVLSKQYLAPPECTGAVGDLRGRRRAYDCDEPIARDKCSLDPFWLRDESLEDIANLPAPHSLADDLRAALEQIEEVLQDLPGPGQMT